jgi:phage virion morphogenesis protein
VSALIDIDNGLDRMQQALGRLARAPVDDLLELLGADLETSTRQRIAVQKHAPDGSAWPPWSAAYAEQRPAKGGMLELDGQLIDSIEWELEGLTVSVGSRMVYALTHQLGDDRRNIPARPYLGLSDEDEETLQATAGAWMERVMEGTA